MPPLTLPPAVVLVVDDEPAIRDVFQAVFHRAGIEVLTAGSSQEALRVLHHAQVDVVLSDYQIPGMTGLDLLARVRVLHPQVARFMMTAYPDAHLAERGVNEARLDRCFIKPVRLAEIVSAVQDVLQERAAEGARARAFARSFDAMHKALEVRADAGLPVSVLAREDAEPASGRKPARFPLGDAGTGSN